MDQEQIEAFAQQFSAFMARMNQLAWTDHRSPPRQMLDEHLGQACDQLPVVTETYAPYDHINVQVAIDAYLAKPDRDHGLVGLTGQSRHFGSLSDIIEMSAQHGVRLGSVDLVELPISPDETRGCVNFGLYLIDDNGTRLVVLMRGPTEHGPAQAVNLEILSGNKERGRAMLAEIRGLIVERNAFRGQVVSFGQSRMGYVGVGPIVFHHRPSVRRDDVILAEGSLATIERQVLGMARQADRLRASGQHVKRGLLLYGPPGNGKTLTVRYLVGSLREHTVILLTGHGLGMVRPACGLARMLQPAMVVLEDVDLVANERTMPGSHGVLFELLNEMDGLAEDGDVTFILTTNRASLLEPALAERPGRVDLAIDVPPPDADARRRLLELYGRALDLRLDDVDSVVARTEGVAAAFMKELMRRAAMAAAERSDDEVLRISDEHLGAALDEMLDASGALNRALLGAPPPNA